MASSAATVHLPGEPSTLSGPDAELAAHRARAFFTTAGVDQP